MQNSASQQVQIKPKSISLSRDDVGKLCDIVIKAADSSAAYSSVSFSLSGGKESISARNKENLLCARWPTTISEISLSARSSTKEIKIRLKFDGLLGYNEISIEGSDVDWVAARVKELERFISDHRNSHWIFQTWSLVIPQLILLIGLITFGLLDFLKNSNEGISFLAILAILYGCGLVYLYGLKRIFSFVEIDSGIPSGRKTAKKFLSWFFPAIILGIVINSIIKFIFG